MNRNIYGKLLKKFYNLVLDKLIINSQSHKKYALGYEFKKYKIINNPFHLESSLFKKINNKHAYVTGKINIVFISIPSKEKGLLESIKLIEKVFVKDDWELNIIGWSKKILVMCILKILISILKA